MDRCLLRRDLEAGKAYSKSANRLVDISLALGGLISHYLIVWTTAGNIANGIAGKWTT